MYNIFVNALIVRMLYIYVYNQAVIFKSFSQSSTVYVSFLV